MRKNSNNQRKNSYICFVLDKSIMANTPKPYKTKSKVSVVLESAVIASYQSLYGNPISVLTNSKNGLSAKAAIDFFKSSPIFPNSQNRSGRKDGRVSTGNRTDQKSDNKLSDCTPSQNHQ